MSKKLTDYFFKRKDKVSSTTPTEQSTSVNGSSSVNDDANMLDVNNPTVNTPDVNTPTVNNPVNISSRMISEDIGAPYHPSSSFNFPKTTFGKQVRSCQASWFIKYPWPHYDERFVHFLVGILLGESHNYG